MLPKPSTVEMEKVYDRLQIKREVLSMSELITFSQWSRYDPRLGEILLGYLTNHWQSINPVEFNSKIVAACWPAVFGVLLDHVRMIIPDTNKHAFKLWQKMCLLNVKSADYELYFINLYAFAGKFARREAELALNPYKKWGYLSAGLMHSKSMKRIRASTVISKEDRIYRIKIFVKQNSRFRIGELLSHFNGLVGVRQLERDLKEIGVKCRGKTKGRVYS